MKFLLINPFLDYTKVNKAFAIKDEIPPLGLLYVASAIEEKGQEVKIVDFCCEDFSQKRLLNVLNNIDAVGITLRTKDVESVKQISKIIKKHHPYIPIIIGGPHCTIGPEKALNQTNADICVKGEGENAIKMIIDSFEGKRELASIPGVYYKEGDNLKKGLPATEIKNLDSIAFPARHLVEQYQYGEVVEGFNATKGKVTSMMCSRGCPFNCRYCINASYNKSYRRRSAENVIEEIKGILGKYDFLHIVDENFFADMNLANKVIDFLAETDHNLEVWISGIRVDAADDKLLSKMKKAGVTTINVGIESGNQDVLDFYNKKTNLEQVKKVVLLARKKGFFTMGYFMLGAPIETEKHLQNTINFAKKLPLDIATFAVFSYRKGAPLWNEAHEKGLINEDEYMVLCDSERGLGNFTQKEIMDWVLKAFKSFYLRPSFILDQIIYHIFIRRDLERIKQGFRFLSSSDNVFKIDASKLHTS